MARRPGSAGDPLVGVELVLVDGNNLVGALARGGARQRGADHRTHGDGPAASGEAGPAGAASIPQGAIIGRLRGAIPASTRVELIFDGPPRGGVTGRLATGFGVRYSGRATADDVILDVVTRQATEFGPASTWSILVVTDDRELREGARMRGARTAGARWLATRIATTERAGNSDRRRGESPGGRPSRGGGSSPGGRSAPSGTPSGGSRPRPGTTIGHPRAPRLPWDASDGPRRSGRRRPSC